MSRVRTRTRPDHTTFQAARLESQVSVTANIGGYRSGYITCLGLRHPWSVSLWDNVYLPAFYKGGEDAGQLAVLKHIGFYDHIVAVCKSRILSSKSAETRYSSYNSVTTTDTVVKNFRRISSSGGIVNNPFSSSKIQCTAGTIQLESTDFNGNDSLDIRLKWGSGRKSRSRGWSLGLSVQAFVKQEQVGFTQLEIEEISSGLGTHMDGQNAINSAFGNVHSGEVELLQMAAEMKDTIALFASTASRVARLVSACKKGRFKNLAPKTWAKVKKNPGSSAKRFAQDAWLEARYAWRPLISDATTIYKIFNEGFKKRATFRGGDANSDESDLVVTTTMGGYPCELKGRLINVRECRAGVLTEASWGDNSARSLGLTNLVGAAWDLVPYSFIVDWFINTGGLIYTLNPNPGFKALASWCTYKTDSVFVGTAEVTAPDGTKKSTNFMCSVTNKDRIPGATPSLLTIDVDLGVSQLIDLTSIFWR